MTPRQRARYDRALRAEKAAQAEVDRLVEAKRGGFRSLATSRGVARRTFAGGMARLERALDVAKKELREAQEHTTAVLAQARLGWE